jgi:hypothetical protein
MARPLPFKIYKALRLSLSTGRVETLAESVSVSPGAGWSTEDEPGACDIDKTYTEWLTSGISVVPMAKQIHADLRAISKKD